MFPILVFWFALAVVSVARSVKKNPRRPVISSDGHEVPEAQDLTCDRYGHVHEPQTNEFGRRYVVHEDPEEGYVILNGVKRKLTDCRNL